MALSTPVKVFKYELTFTSSRGKEVRLQVDALEDIEDLELYHDMQGGSVHVRRGSFLHWDHPQPWT